MGMESGEWRVESGEWRVESGELGVGEAVVFLQAPDDIGGRTAATATVREEHLGVEAVDEGRVQVVLRLRTKEMTDAIHGAKIRINDE